MEIVNNRGRSRALVCVCVGETGRVSQCLRITNAWAHCAAALVHAWGPRMRTAPRSQFIAHSHSLLYVLSIIETFACSLDELLICWQLVRRLNCFYQRFTCWHVHEFCLLWIFHKLTVICREYLSSFRVEQLSIIFTKVVHNDYFFLVIILKTPYSLFKVTSDVKYADRTTMYTEYWYYWYGI